MSNGAKTSALIGTNGETVALKSVHINGRIDGLMLNVKVRQSYRNDSGHNLETVYTFPLAWGATLLGLNVELNGMRMQATVLEKKQATENYENAIDAGDTPVMVEKSASGLYTANLGNLMAGEEAVIELEYAQVLRFEQGHVRLSIPTTIAPRFGDAHRQGGLAAHETDSVNPLAEYPFTLKVDICGEVAKATVSCPSHKVSITAIERGMSVRLEQGAMLDRDFILSLDGLQGQCFAVTAPDGDQHAVLASFCPTLPIQEDAPLFLKILVDCSGSMQGDSNVQARRALHEVFQYLTPADRVSYSKFGSTVEHVVAKMEPCTSRFVGKVLAQALKLTDANLGGTELNQALLSTFEIKTPADKEQDAAVLLITDGEVWDIEPIVSSAAKSRHRIFAVGVGSAPAESLLRDLAEKSGGACELVSPNENMAAAVLRMFNRMRAARAVDIEVNWGEPPLWQSRLGRQLFDGETVHVFAQFASAPSSAPMLVWQAGGQRLQVQAEIFSTDVQATVARMAGAARMIQTPSNEEALALALKYQLVSDQTNLILVHVRAEGEKASSLPALQQVEQMLAAGWGGVGSVRENRVRHSMQASHDSMATPSVWRTSDRAVAAAKVDALAKRGIDVCNFEMPVFLRKQASEGVADALVGTVSKFIQSALGGSGRGQVIKPVKPPVFQSSAKPRNIDSGPIATPLEILQTYEDIAVNQLTDNSLVSVLQNLNIPEKLATVLDDLTTQLGSGAKAWAVVIKWLTDALADQFILSRQGERLLRQSLKTMDADSLALVLQQIEQKLGPVGIAWSVNCHLPMTKPDGQSRQRRHG